MYFYNRQIVYTRNISAFYLYSQVSYLQSTAFNNYVFFRFSQMSSNIFTVKQNEVKTK